MTLRFGTLHKNWSTCNHQHAILKPACSVQPGMSTSAQEKPRPGVAEQRCSSVVTCIAKPRGEPDERPTPALLHDEDFDCWLEVSIVRWVSPTRSAAITYGRMRRLLRRRGEVPRRSNRRRCDRASQSSKRPVLVPVPGDRGLSLLHAARERDRLPPERRRRERSAGQVGRASPASASPQLGLECCAVAARRACLQPRQGAHLRARQEDAAR